MQEHDPQAVFTQAHIDGRLVVHARGEIDGFTAAQLRRRLLALTRAGERDLVVDLTGATFMDSAGLGALVATRKVAQARRARLTLVVPEHLLRLFQLTGLHHAFAIHRDLDEALAASDDRDAP